MTTDNRASEHDSTTNPALAVHVSQLVKRYGDMVALDYFDLDVNQGEIFGLLGPNGSGKTTAINCILALLTYDSGTIRVFGQPMTRPLRAETLYRHRAAERGPCSTN